MQISQKSSPGAIFDQTIKLKKGADGLLDRIPRAGSNVYAAIVWKFIEIKNSLARTPKRTFVDLRSLRSAGIGRIVSSMVSGARIVIGTFRRTATIGAINLGGGNG